MDQTTSFINGVLLYSTPNKHTITNQFSPFYTVSYKVNFTCISEDEKYIVGTHCGTKLFNEERVNLFMKVKNREITELTLLNYLNLKSLKELDKYFFGESYISYR